MTPTVTRSRCAAHGGNMTAGSSWCSETPAFGYGEWVCERVDEAFAVVGPLEPCDNPRCEKGDLRPLPGVSCPFGHEALHEECGCPGGPCSVCGGSGHKLAVPASRADDVQVFRWCFTHRVIVHPEDTACQSVEPCRVRDAVLQAIGGST